MRSSLIPLLLIGLISSCADETGAQSLAGRPVGQASPQLAPVNDAVSASRTFDYAGTSAVPMNFESVALDLALNPAQEVATGRATIQFQAIQAGRPYFLLNGQIQSLQLNGQPVRVDRTETPSGDQVNVLDVSVPAGSTQTLLVEYALDPEQITFRTDGVGFVTAMADIDDGNFFEDYGPASFEDDQLKMTVNLSLVGTSKPHQLFTNGTATQAGPSTWTIDFPPYFTTSGFYMHLTDAALAVRQTTYQGLEKTIPITAYSASESSADAAIAALPGLFAELERDYGPYLHNSFTAYISGAGGMEHGGATITSLSALGHELTHSWFGRGVMPAGGSSGWIDEAVATWRDRGYPRSGNEQSLQAANIGNLSSFERFTPFAAYDQGGDILTFLDSMFAGSQGGLKPVLRDFFAQWKARLVLTPDFENFLETRTGTDLSDFFARYVTGREAGGTVGTTPPPAPGTTLPGTLHPPSLGPDEIRDLR